MAPLQGLGRLIMYSLQLMLVTLATIVVVAGAALATIYLVVPAIYRRVSRRR